MTRLTLLLILLATPALADVQVAFSPGNAEQTVIAAIDSAQRTIHLAAYSFTSRPIAQALLAAKARGVEVAAVMDKIDEGKVARLLPGIPVRIDRWYAIQHNKFLVIDGQTVETGSFNYSHRAATVNAENVVVLRDMPDVAARYEQEWRRMWNESEAP